MSIARLIDPETSRGGVNGFRTKSLGREAHTAGLRILWRMQLKNVMAGNQASDRMVS